MATDTQLENLLSMLYTNMNNLDSIYYDMFINTTAMDVILERYDSEGVLQKYTLPNRAKDANFIKQGSGSPIGVILGNAGTLYLDITNYELYFKSAGSDSYGWIKIYSYNKFVVGVDYLAPTGNGSQLTNLNMNNASSGALAVSYGGTGATSLTGLIKGNGTNSFTVAVANKDYVETLTPRFAVNQAAISNSTGIPDYLSGVGTTTLTLQASQNSPVVVTYANSKQNLIVDNITYTVAYAPAWDITTLAATPSKSFWVSQDYHAYGLAISTDGTKMYVLGDNTDKVYQYTLSTSWDVSTATYSNKYISVAGQEMQCTGLAFSTDGTKMYVLGMGEKKVFQYTLSTPWDVSTATYSSKSLLVSSQTPTPYEMVFSPDGTKMFVRGIGVTNAIYLYVLSTAWDVSTATYSSKSFILSTLSGGPLFNTDGSKMFIIIYEYINNQPHRVAYQYTLGTSWDISTASYAGMSETNLYLGEHGHYMSSDGLKMYSLSDGTVYQTNLGADKSFTVCLNNYNTPELVLYDSNNIYIQPYTPSSIAGTKWLNTSKRPFEWNTYSNGWKEETTNASYADIILGEVYLASNGNISKIVPYPLNHNFVTDFNNDTIKLGAVSSGVLNLTPNAKYSGTLSSSTLVSLPKIPKGQEVNIQLSLKVSTTSLTTTWSSTIYWMFENPPLLSDTTQTYEILLTYNPVTVTWEGRWGAKTL